eukprot:TRINITY_DN32333_c0_g1_i1.p1 TRINITY_DN32333_c0_g1~~TRINITY_DN32333_c0_g1_i1.p1  ORF type:complete len:652 (-),score=113.97 TRINITY_DN32333_c0_g1_i1:160-2061(-)
MSSSSASSEHRLYKILGPRKYLLLENHTLNGRVEDIKRAIKDPEAGDAADLLDRLDMEIASEEEALANAFRLFDNQKQGALSKSDVKNMNRYLGFPAEDSDIDSLMHMIDIDKNGTIAFDEFSDYVGRMGGMGKLYEERQKRIKEKLGYECSVGMDEEADSLALNLAGIDREARAYWKLVVQPSEFCEAARLTSSQQNAVKHIRMLAKKNHQDALPALRERITNMSFKEEDLWLTLAWIRELAPIIVHINLDKMLQFMESDTHYRNQFETNTSGGLLKPKVREKWERDLFGGCYDGAKGSERPKYGVQNVMNDPRGVIRCAQYGDSYIILKDARLRCTFAPEDSANLKADRLAVLDFYGHVLAQYDDNELRETIKVATSAEAALLGDSDKVGKMKYKEAQIHGEVCFSKHVERLVAATRHRDKDEGSRIQAMCAKHGFGFSWMDEERDRMKKEGAGHLGGAAWQERLHRLEKEVGDLDIPEGFCRSGCGRPVAPGVTRAGKPFKTCCRGCIMGFGHDKHCGAVDASKVGPGLCVKGCGRKVAPGTDAKDRPYQTCCRGCANGLAHDRFCQQQLVCPPASKGSTGYSASEPGMCKVGCGRKVAPGVFRNGKPFDTCCRDCVGSGGSRHSANCIL